LFFKAKTRRLLRELRLTRRPSGIRRSGLELWRFDYNNFRSHSSLGNKTPAEARWALELFDCTAPDALAEPETDDCQT
jgi:transposase InsO family protein